MDYKTITNNPMNLMRYTSSLKNKGDDESIVFELLGDFRTDVIEGKEGCA